MWNRSKSIALATLVLIVAGCAAPQKKKEEVVFFPPPPELPRVQYLTSYTGTRDIEEQSGFRDFVVGEKENRRLDKPYGVAIYDGKIYVCDTNATVFVFDLKNKTYGPLKGAKGNGKLMQPLNISIEADGTKYVADPVRKQVVAFDRNDEFLRAYGISGEWRPVDAFAFEDKLYVADFSNKVIRVFDKKTGDIVKSFGDKGGVPEKLEMPTNLTVGPDGDIYVSDAGRFQVVKFDRDGHFLSAIGKLGDHIGHFARPKGVALDRAGNIYAVDAAFNNVQVFNKDGRILLFFGEGGRKPGNLLLPAKVAIDYDNIEYFRQFVQPNFDVQYLIIITSQFGDRAVNVFGYGMEKGKKYPSDEEVMQAIQEQRKEEWEKLRKAAGITDDSGKKETPADSGKKETPADSGVKETPADSGKKETPAEKGN